MEEDEGLVDAQDSHGSNTTRSFIEHEADLEVQSFMAENHQKNGTLPSMVNINIDLTELTVKHVEASKVMFHFYLNSFSLLIHTNHC